VHGYGAQQIWGLHLSLLGIPALAYCRWDWRGLYQHRLLYGLCEGCCLYCFAFRSHVKYASEIISGAKLSALTTLMLKFENKRWKAPVRPRVPMQVQVQPWLSFETGCLHRVRIGSSCRISGSSSPL